MEWTITQLNIAGEIFVGLALPMLLTSMVLTGLVLFVEFVLRARVRAGLRYWLVTCVLVYLVLTPLLSLRPPSTHWLAGTAAYAHSTPAPASHLNAPLSQPATGRSEGGYAYGARSSGVERGAVPTPRDATARRNEPRDPSTTRQSTLAGIGERPRTLTWQGAAFLFWLTGAAIIGGVLIHRALAACERVDRTRAANYLMNDILVYCRKRMGIHGPIRLRVGEEGVAPAVCGLISPVIVVPRNLTPTLGSRHLRDVLFHELAHVKRYDLWVNFAQNVL
jgi:beta-lactamase regulating signal transducer with metallopeptidase domain